MSTPPLPFVALARPDVINDRLMAQLRRIAHDAPLSLATPAEAEWLVSVCGPLLDELALRRAVMAGMACSIDLSNVVILPAVPG